MVARHFFVPRRAGLVFSLASRLSPLASRLSPFAFRLSAYLNSRARPYDDQPVMKRTNS